MPDPITPPAISPAPTCDVSSLVRHETGPTEGQATGNARLRQLAQEFEAVFLAQMLKSAGLGRGAEGFDGGFDGGMGEAQMQSFVIDAKARAIAASGGIGLAETVFRYLAAKEGADDMDPAQ